MIFNSGFPFSYWLKTILVVTEHGFLLVPQEILRDKRINSDLKFEKSLKVNLPLYFYFLFFLNTCERDSYFAQTFFPCIFRGWEVQTECSILVGLGN